MNMSSETNSPIMDSSPWSISVRTVGGELVQTNQSINGKVPCDFTVEVSPEDSVEALYDQIADVTGLQASQQRLIYRGRLIGGHNNGELVGRASLDFEDSAEEVGSGKKAGKENLKIKDIAGLGDGQTIHLLRKNDRPADVSRENDSTSSQQESGTQDESRSSGTGTSSLLAALLGMTSMDDDDDEESLNEGAGRRVRVSRLGPRRRPHYRLASEDLEVRDPGSMESVRQGLLTLHTLIPTAMQSLAIEEQVRRRGISPLDANRRWYRGQWIDCRDTVNQWLEATIVDIVEPNDILPVREDQVSRTSACHRLTTQAVDDPAVAASDLEGRRRLLLEPCEVGSEYDEGGELAGMRRRQTNDGVQLLLIHYNGWPHRWDEWIRSDSERIRPFRVRTRHPTVSPFSSPTPQSVFTDAPSTAVRSDDEAVDRTALVSELARVVSQLHGLLEHASASLGSTSDSTGSATFRSGNNNLPWLTSANEEHATVQTSIARGEAGGSLSDADRNRLRRQELAALAPLLDRLGRVLIDAAPHVAYMASNTDSGRSHEVEQPSTATRSADAPTTLGSLLSLLGRDRRRQATMSSSSSVPSDNVATSIGTSEQTVSTSGDTLDIDPDYMDFANGFVNTSRGEVRQGPRTRNGPGDEVAGILGAYLAAAALGGLSSGNVSDGGNGIANNNLQGLGRLLSERGDGATGIDIHIHAVVTSPGTQGVVPGIGIMAIGGGTPAAVATSAGTGLGNLLSANRELRQPSSIVATAVSPALQQDDDMGIFAELYSDNPDPIDHYQSPTAERSESSRDGSIARNLSRDMNNVRSSGLPSQGEQGRNSRPDGSAGAARRSGNVFSRFFRRNAQE